MTAQFMWFDNPFFGERYCVRTTGQGFCGHVVVEEIAAVNSRHRGIEEWRDLMRELILKSKLRKMTVNMMI